MQYRTEDNKLVKACLFSTATWVNELVGENLYYTSYYGFRIMFVHFIPCTALVILNLLLFRTLKLVRQNRKKLFSRCTGATATSNQTNSSKATTTTMLNKSSKNNLIYRAGNEEKNKRNLKSKLSNAFTTIILSNTSLPNTPKLNSKNKSSSSKGIEEITSSLPDTFNSTTDNSNCNSNNNLNNLSTNCPTNNQSNDTNQLIAHQITVAANRTSSSASIHSNTSTASNQVSSPTSIYRMRTSSLTNGDPQSTTVNAAQNKIVNTVVCTTSSSSTLINTPTNSMNKIVNTAAVNTPSILLTTSYITNNAANLNSKLNSSNLNNLTNKVNCNLNFNLNEHNLIDYNQNDNVQINVQQNEFNGCTNILANSNLVVDNRLVDNKLDLKSDRKRFGQKPNDNQLNLATSNQLKNFTATEKLSKEKSPLNNVQKTSSCKKLNNLENRRQRDNQCTTLMLIVIVSVFLLTEIPLAITTLLHVTQNILEIYIANYKTLNSTILFTNFFIMLSYPVNFAIYCGMSYQFRETFKLLILKRLFCKGNSKTNGRYTTTTNATYSNYECSRVRQNSVTNQLTTTSSLNLIQIKNNKLTSQANSSQLASDYSTTSNQINNKLGESTGNLSKQSKNSDLELNEGTTIKEINKEENEEIKDEKRIRFKTDSFELENCDLNNNRMLNNVNNEVAINFYSNQLENGHLIENRCETHDRPPYIETNL